MNTNTKITGYRELTQEEIDKHNEYEQEIYDINKNLFNLFK